MTGRRLRVDTTVVETNMHYPTDSNLLGNGVRVLTRLMKRVNQVAGQGGTSFPIARGACDRRLIEIGGVTRSKSACAMGKIKMAYRKLGL